MNCLDAIKAFAYSQDPQSVPGQAGSAGATMASLRLLAESNEWLGDSPLVERVVRRLETIDPQSPEERTHTVAIYMKIIGRNNQPLPVALNTISINISDHETCHLPKRLLMAESTVFKQQLTSDADQPIDLIGQASEESLACFVTYLQHGSIDFITNDNAVELLLLARSYELTELSMACLEHILEPERRWTGQSDVNRPHTQGESSLRALLIEAKACCISISRPHFPSKAAAHVKMGDGSTKRHWDCLFRLHDFIPVTHLELTATKNLDELANFIVYNRAIVSLNLGDSPDITDEYLEEISHNLPEINSFAISKNTIRAVPPTICNRLKALNCSYCYTMGKIEAPNATEVACNNCFALICLEAPKATGIFLDTCPVLKTFSAPNAKTIDCCYCRAIKNVTTNAKTISFYHCDTLGRIEAPHAKTVCCSHNRSLRTVVAPRAAMLSCDYCVSLVNITTNAISLSCAYCDTLTNISATSATTINCHNCPDLTVIDAPKVQTLNCNTCHSLATVEAPDASILNCSYCGRLTRVIAPKVTNLHINNCPGLFKIEAPNAVGLYCGGCDALTSIDAPSATTISCGFCNALTRLSAPLAKTIYCNRSPALISIVAPNATTLFCHMCPSLTSIEAPNLIALNCGDCVSLPNDVKSELYWSVRRNIILTYYTNINTLIERLSELHRNGASMYGVHDVEDHPLDRWFAKAHQLTVPADFASEEESLQCMRSINRLLRKLMLLAAADKTRQSVNLNWFMSLKKLNNLQQQIQRVLWLGSLLACAENNQNPLCDPEATPTLVSIGNLADPLLQAGATRALLAIYGMPGDGRRAAWKRLNEQRPEHVLLPSLFLLSADIDLDIATKLLNGLESRYYRSWNILNPISEMTYLLSREKTLSPVGRDNLLMLIMNAPKKQDRESAKSFDKKLEDYRCEQPKWVTACRDLLHFGRGHMLNGIQNTNDLLATHKNVCQAIFAVREERLLTFTDTFKSKRYPNGLFTYAARLQTLPDDQKDLLTELLGKFVNGQLEGTFPESRYNLSNNPHLSKVFRGKEQLLNKWTEPFEIDIVQTDLGSHAPLPQASDLVAGMMQQAINNKHLGRYQKMFYPSLIQALQKNEPQETQAILNRLEIRRDELKSRLSSAHSDDHRSMQASLGYLEIEIYSLKALDPFSELSVRLVNLRKLLALIPDELEFKHDVEGIIGALDQPKASGIKWLKVQTTDSWEDSLLAGTEVSNSCQRIDGDPDLNKCLLAYILDGKNLLMIVRDSEEKIAARSVLRILWNERRNHPVLFMERIYTRTADPILCDLILKGCVEKAKYMGLPLVCSPSSYPKGRPYRGVLEALGGPAPFEYVDALLGIQPDGVFTIPSSNIIYTPDVGHALGRGAKAGAAAGPSHRAVQ